MTRPSAFYACNVFHYHHVVEAMRTAGFDVALATRHEFSHAQVRRLRRLPLPGAVKALAERRLVERPVGLDVTGLGPAALVLPLSARVDVIPLMTAYRVAADGQARWIARRARQSDLFQFSEGLGHRVLAHGFDGFSICERRHLHHEALEGDPGVVGDFPHHDQLDPIGEFLDFEYAASDRIAVYSEVARDSFLERGFDPSKIIVTPLGMPELDHGGPVPQREPHTLAFVGRGDAFKGLDIAVAAVAEMGPPHHLEVAGACTSEVRAWLAAKSHVTYRGILGKQGLRDLYRRAQVLLNPSIESFGYAALEGASYGARLVCATTTGAREYLPTGTHLAVAGRDPAVWAEACAAAMQLGDPMSDVQAALQPRSWSRAASYLVPLYSGLLPAFPRG